MNLTLYTVYRVYNYCTIVMYSYPGLLF